LHRSGPRLRPDGGAAPSCAIPWTRKSRAERGPLGRLISRHSTRPHGQDCRPAPAWSRRRNPPDPYSPRSGSPAAGDRQKHGQFIRDGSVGWGNRRRNVCLRSRFLTEPMVQRAGELRQGYRLGQIVVEARRQASVPFPLEGIRRQRDDGESGAVLWVRPDQTRRREAIHFGHLTIHKDNVVVRVANRFHRCRPSGTISTWCPIFESMRRITF